jgi:hypothetical protein
MGMAISHSQLPAGWPQLVCLSQTENYLTYFSLNHLLLSLSGMGFEIPSLEMFPGGWPNTKVGNQLKPAAILKFAGIFKFAASRR